MSRRSAPAGRLPLNAIAASIAVLLSACGGGELEEANEPLAQEARPLAAVAKPPAVAATMARIQEQSKDHCLVPSTAPAPGVPIGQAACTQTNELFDVLPLASGSSVARLRLHATTLCAAVKDAKSGASVKLVLAQCGTGKEQQFEFRPVASGDLQLVAQHSSLCVEVRNAGVSQQACDPKAKRLAQLFELVAGTAAPSPAPTPAPTPSPTPAPTPAPSAHWTPKVTDTWQWQLTGTINTGYNALVYDIDLFESPQATINSLKANGHRVVCYFSAGSSETFRTDFSRFNASDMGANLDGWPGERWLDTRSANVRAIMQSRLDLAASRGCDGVEPDNMDGYLNKPGFPLTAATQLDFNRFIAREARARGLAVALKNTVDLLAQLEPDFDFAVNEQCHQYDECDGYSVFISKGKPVFNAEYANKWVTRPAERAKLCAASRASNFRTLVLPLALDDSLRFGCD